MICTCKFAKKKISRSHSSVIPTENKVLPTGWKCVTKVVQQQRVTMILQTQVCKCVTLTDILKCQMKWCNEQHLLVRKLKSKDHRQTWNQWVPESCKMLYSSLSGISWKRRGIHFCTTDHEQLVKVWRKSLSSSHGGHGKLAISTFKYHEGFTAFKTTITDQSAVRR